MVTGGMFVNGIVDMASNVSAPVHFYVYDHSGMVSMNKIYGSCLQNLGVSHGDEIMSLFCAEGLVVLFGEDLKVSKVMVDMWTSFAITGYVYNILNDRRPWGDNRTSPTFFQKISGEKEKVLNSVKKLF